MTKREKFLLIVSACVQGIAVIIGMILNVLEMLTEYVCPSILGSLGAFCFFTPIIIFMFKMAGKVHNRSGRTALLLGGGFFLLLTVLETAEILIDLIISLH